MRLAFTAVLICLVLTAEATSGGSLPDSNRVELSAYAGALIFDVSGFSDSFLAGVRGAYHLDRRYALEASLGYSSSAFTGTREDLRTGRPVSVIGEDAAFYFYFVNLQYKFRLSRVVTTFTEAGIGGITLSPLHGASDSDLTFDFGGGVKFFVRENTAVRLEFRTYASSIDVGGFFPGRGSFFLSPRRSLDMFELSGGITFAL